MKIQRAIKCWYRQVKDWMYRSITKLQDMSI